VAQVVVCTQINTKLIYIHIYINKDWAELTVVECSTGDKYNTTGL